MTIEREPGKVRVTFAWPIPDGEHWTDEAIASLIGQGFRCTAPGIPPGVGTVVTATRLTGSHVAAVRLTVEVPDAAGALLPQPITTESFSLVPKI